MRKFTKSIFIALMAMLCAWNVTAQEMYNITLIPSPLFGGMVYGNGMFSQGETVYVFASYFPPYNFINWTEDGIEVSTNATYTFTVEGDRTLVAHFAPAAYQVLLFKTPFEGGTVTGGGVYEFGSFVTVTATPAPGYEFIYWMNEYGTPVFSGSQYTFSVTQNYTLVALFAPAASFEVTVSANPPQGGTVTGGGVYEFGQPITVTATPAPGYTFIYWTNEYGEPFSTDQQFTFAVMQNHTLIAHFAPAAYQVLLSTFPVSGGTVTGQGFYEPGTEATVTATPQTYFEFGGWWEDGIIVFEDPEYTFTVTGDRYLAAYFNITTTPFEIIVSANPPEGGTVTGGGSYTIGSSVTVSAEAHQGYLFLNWTENGNIVSTALNYSFSVYGPRNLVANFAPATCEIKLTKNIEEGGTVGGAGIYPYGQTIIVHATANLPEYMFSCWTENGNVVKTSPIYSFPVTQSRHLVAHFVPAFYQIHVYANPYEGGTVAGGGVYTYGTQVTLSATAKEGYQFLNWTRFVSGNGTVVSTDPDYTFEVTGEYAYIAYFVEGAKVTVLTNIPEGEVLGGGTYHYGDEVTLEAIPHSGYKFVSWTEGRGVISTENPYTFTVTEDKVIVAIFEEDETLSVEPIDAGAMMIYPNPTNSDMTVVLNNSALKITEMELYDLTGRKVHQQTVNQSSGTLQLNELAQGAYILKVYLDQGEVVTWRVVKN